MKDPNVARPRLSLPPSSPPRKPPTAAETAQAPAEPTWTRFKLRRDGDRPLEFDGVAVGHVEDRAQSPQTAGLATITRLALYQTKGGKYITEFSRFEEEPVIPNPRAPRPVFFAKAGVFASRDIALQWFRKGGSLTIRLLEQLGELDSEFIE